MVGVATWQGRRLRNCKENGYFSRTDSDGIYTPATMCNFKRASSDLATHKGYQNLPYTSYIPLSDCCRNT